MITENRGALIAPGVLIGAGMGGFVDGIVLHQIAQWHNMLSSWIPPLDVVSLKVNMIWDGLFHALTWLMTAVGIGLLWHAGARSDVEWSGRTFTGSVALGWGLFNVVEGVLDHHVLGIHHVHPGRDELAWDLAFLAFGAVLVVLGVVLVWRPRRRAAHPRPRRTPAAAT
jgi:uncharacterized membrane protein